MRYVFFFFEFSSCRIRYQVVKQKPVGWGMVYAVCEEEKERKKIMQILQGGPEQKKEKSGLLYKHEASIDRNVFRLVT